MTAPPPRKGPRLLMIAGCVLMVLMVLVLLCGGLGVLAYYYLSVQRSETVVADLESMPPETHRIELIPSHADPKPQQPVAPDVTDLPKPPVLLPPDPTAEEPKTPAPQVTPEPAVQTPDPFTDLPPDPAGVTTPQLPTKPSSEPATDLPPDPAAPPAAAQPSRPAATPAKPPQKTTPAPTPLPRVSATDLPDNFPADLPQYPGAKLTRAGGIREPGKVNGGQASFDAPGKPAAAADWYEAQMKAKGWEKVIRTEVGTSEILQFSKGKRMAHLTVALSAEGRTSLVLQYWETK